MEKVKHWSDRNSTFSMIVELVFFVQKLIFFVAETISDPVWSSISPSRRLKFNFLLLQTWNAEETRNEAKVDRDCPTLNEKKIETCRSRTGVVRSWRFSPCRKWRNVVAESGLAVVGGVIGSTAAVFTKLLAEDGHEEPNDDGDDSDVERERRRRHFRGSFWHYDPTT